MSYLESLLLRLAGGVSSLPTQWRTRQAQWLEAAQGANGGFAGRRGDSDCYYTGFGLRALAILGGLDQPVAERAAAFLSGQLGGGQRGGGQLGRPLPPVDYLSAVNSALLLEAVAGIDLFAAVGIDRRMAVETLAARLKRDDGGYAKTDRSGPSSTYQTFLVALALQSVDASPPEADALIRTVIARQQPDGGFTELPVLAQSGTNPTAAAVGLLASLGALDAAVTAGAVRYLAGMQTAEGGLRANARAPAADLLSTFTGIVALGDLNALGAIDVAAARRFVAALEYEGGFRAGLWDDAADVEYTFYGVGTLGLLGA